MNQRSNHGPSSWMAHKEEGRCAFESEDYSAALASYRKALNPIYEAPRPEQQIILSNIVACRLKIGGPVQAEAAIDDAKNCIALDNSWAKGYIRLASAYIALGGHSNDACNSLQTALRLDSGSRIAREMLMRELRRDNASSDYGRNAAAAQESSPSQGVEPPGRPDPSYRSRPQHRSSHDSAADEANPHVTWRDSLCTYISRGYVGTLTWYSRLPAVARSWLQVTLMLILLYVAFGGRFGLEYASQDSKSSRHFEENAYDRFRRKQRNGFSYSSGDTTNPRNPPGGSSSSYHYYSAQKYATNGSNMSSNWGPVSSKLLLLGIAYAFHKIGINPVYALWLGDRGRNLHRRGFMFRGGGFGFGGGGFGFGGGGFGGFNGARGRQRRYWGRR